MVNVLIPTKPDDTHAVYTQMALEKKGHKGLLWYTADFPIQQTHSFKLKNHTDFCWTSQGTEFEIHNEKYDVVWLRRPKKPVLPKSLHADDYQNAKQENLMFFQTFWNVILPDALWINPINNAKIANCKLLQLKIASQVGLKIPETLISNNPQTIKNFIQENKKETVIYKTLFPMVWLAEKEIRLTYTKTVSLNDLPPDSILQSTPGIFQKRIPKAYELRVTYFGNYSVAVKLNSQEHPKGILDWRYVPTMELMIEEYQLPSSIDEYCRALMKKMGIIFGCFDFIVTPDKEYYFLEVNEQGQFLWIENINPNIKMLDIFTEFLINKNTLFTWKKTPDSVSLSDFEKKAETALKRAVELHQDTEKF